MSLYSTHSATILAHGSYRKRQEAFALMENSRENHKSLFSNIPHYCFNLLYCHYLLTVVSTVRWTCSVLRLLEVSIRATLGMKLLQRDAIFNLQEMTTSRKAKRNLKQLWFKPVNTACPLNYYHHCMGSFCFILLYYSLDFISYLLHFTANL